jgi:tetratricopeptide (TPR) repeat protein
MSTATINFYEQLGLDRDATVAQIQERLTVLRLQLSSKAARPSSRREHFQQQLEDVALAEVVFADEESRERYDVELRRAGEAGPSAAAVDWTSRAWNYYFIGDNGAAAVAARKAKEQAPHEAMPFVVSAWVQLKDKEFKAAKHDADEAFVLDEETTDLVDVQMVRGTVYYVLDDFERALTSFDRALPKAVPAERAELYWRIALARGDMGDHKAAYEAALEGLCVDVELGSELQKHLETTLCSVINTLDFGTQDRAASITRLNARKAAVGQAPIKAGKGVVLKHIDESIALLERQQALVKEREAAERVSDVSGLQPSVPLGPMGVAFVVFWIMIGAFNLAAGAGLFFLLVFVAVVGFVIYAFNQRSTWAAGRAAYEAAQRRLDDVRKRAAGTPAGPVPPPHTTR